MGIRVVDKSITLSWFIDFFPNNMLWLGSQNLLVNFDPTQDQQRLEGRIKNKVPSFKIISKWLLFLQKKRKPVPFEHFCGWKQTLLGVCNHETYRLTGSRPVFGWGWGGAGAFPPLLSSTSQSHLWGLAPLYQPPESDGNPFTGCLTSSNPVSQTSSLLKPTQWQALSLLPVDILTVLIKQISILW